MARKPLFLILLLALAMAVLIALPVSAQSPSAQHSAASASPPDVRVMVLDDAIGPAVSDWFVRALEDANDEAAALFVLQLNTPGGLDHSMRAMIRALLDSRVPVAIHVAPSGSRAASAGTYLLYAAHIAAMAPATNLGAATPVELGGGAPAPKPAGSDGEDQNTAPDSATALRNKQVNDAVAYIRGLAELRGRNADWAEQAVRQGASLPAEEALEQNVIDLIADDLPALLSRLEGWEIEIRGQRHTLTLSGSQVRNIEQDWRTGFLAIITNPSVAYLLLLVGIYGLILEFSSPGVGVAGVLGGICLLVAAYALHLLPVSYVGLALIVLGIGLIAAEALSPSFGVLGIGGVAAFVIGSVMLMDTELPAFQIALPVIAAVGTGSLLLVGVIIRLITRSRRQALVSGADTLLGQSAVAIQDFEMLGMVHINGELWRARTATPVRKGQRLRVIGRNGLTLNVEDAS
ncbi:putative membrane-bound ClpP-class protease [Alcanivorax xiamenensis]|uniref:Membrane-bound ClpP-class protease n=1 Tax=Alcanivorax xiamenensis TaxID=1177156 RepID=A0ABQ6Y990_9GAMM|nr:nodulation protein NfeD [Alcanivorax xiamenensis]KAF0806281.1 putative membrane-bound ClpP-class protease [Alcanivorax xiamenensis]